MTRTYYNRSMSPSRLISTRYYVNGMHCASCEILIEKRLIKESTIEMVDAHLSRNEVLIEHQKGDRITPAYLNKIFSTDGYCFSTQPFKKSARTADNSSCAIPAAGNPYQALFFALLLIIGFLFLNQTGFASLVAVSSTSSLPVFFVFGLLAGFSSCAALVGGIILSLSKQWVGNYGNSDDTLIKLQPHFLFNAGRILGYASFGALLGLVGNFFKLSPYFTAALVVSVSILMILLALQMLGLKAFAGFRLRLPKFITGAVADESNFQGRFAPVLMGALTFFLPCGFTMTAQALALASGSPLTGALIMGLFALGTLPGLLAIGVSSVKLYSNPRRSGQFSMIAGILVLFFALFNINNQLAVIGLPNLSSVLATPATTAQSVTQTATALITDGKQVIQMLATSGGYSPNQFTVKAGTPVSWQVTNDGKAGCGASIVAQGLFSDRIDTIPGQVVTKEFTPTTPGVYRFSCTMGMYTGTITVVDANGSTGTGTADPVASGSQGCGCGGGGAATSCH